jgi:hypothetical protein
VLVDLVVCCLLRMIVSRRRVVAYLVAEALGRDYCDFITDALVGLEVEGELRVVSLNDDLGGLLDGL